MSEGSSSPSKMNTLIVVSVACLVTVLSADVETDTKPLDTTDVDVISSYGECMLDDASCSEIGAKMKGLLPSLHVYIPLL
jgi:hypothetical protein